MPQTFMAPKGLISILLFFAIPESLKAESFESGVLFVVIIATSIIMAWGLIVYGKRKTTSFSENLDVVPEETEVESSKLNIPKVEEISVN